MGGAAEGGKEGRTGKAIKHAGSASGSTPDPTETEADGDVFAKSLFASRAGPNSQIHESGFWFIKKNLNQKFKIFVLKGFNWGFNDAEMHFSKES